MDGEILCGKANMATIVYSSSSNIILNRFVITGLSYWCEIIFYRNFRQTCKDIYTNLFLSKQFATNL